MAPRTWASQPDSLGLMKVWAWTDGSQVKAFAALPKGGRSHSQQMLRGSQPPEIPVSEAPIPFSGL